MAVVACLWVLAPGADPGAAQDRAQDRQEPIITTAPEPLTRNPPAEARRQARPRPRVNVTPRYPYRTYHSIYPLPYDYEYPGPNAVRRCAGRLVTEHRASGTVVVPRLHCWWARR